MTFLVAAFFVNLALSLLRVLAFQPPVSRVDPRYVAVLAGALIADFVAAYGFFMLIQQPPGQTKSYSLIITLLALLAAASLIGKFAFRREGDGTQPEQRAVDWAASGSVTVSLYLLFGSIAYYSKVIEETNLFVTANLVVPAVMLMILWINSAYDSWDFAERSNPPALMRNGEPTR